MSGFTRKKQQVFMEDEPNKVVPNQTLISGLVPLASELYVRINLPVYK